MTERASGDKQLFPVSAWRLPIELRHIFRDNLRKVPFEKAMLL
ncbi:hypothetical protein [Tritonibacter scottomollicae]|uniref:Uncharacterized protein n=1 Tax=Tritonibacter scottomollicae TaxID=483013 RepID=A0A2T1A815_TRISK|nr:hypothetical protein [Tritonibacter scottomollicae]PRZ44694.1 hypothetical protein CLV89_12127 [Tritonibacter scottomollicae]